MALWTENYDNQMVNEDDIVAKTLEHFLNALTGHLFHDALAVFL